MRRTLVVAASSRPRRPQSAAGAEKASAARHAGGGQPMDRRIFVEPWVQRVGLSTVKLVLVWLGVLSASPE